MLVEYHLDSIYGVTSSKFQKQSARELNLLGFTSFSKQENVVGVIELYDEANPTDLCVTNLGVIEPQQGLGVGSQIITWLVEHSCSNRLQNYKTYSYRHASYGQ